MVHGLENHWLLKYNPLNLADFDVEDHLKEYSDKPPVLKEIKMTKFHYFGEVKEYKTYKEHECEFILHPLRNTQRRENG